ncbi:MAG TPA: ABC transporter substrate-binding protein [Nakamurella sp.]
MNPRTTRSRRGLFRGAGLLAAGLAALLTVSACGGGSSGSPLGTTSAAASGSESGSAAAGGSIVIGSGNFPESALLANIYAAALTKAGVDASTTLNIGSREVYIKAIEDGSIDLIPEYSGVLLQQFDPTATAVSPDDVYAALVEATPQGLSVLEKSAAENKDAVVVTKATADANNLTSIADLAPVAATFILGGPPEWATRPTGVPGLKEKYGLTFKEFKPLDAGGPLTLNALTSDQIQAGNLFTTDAAILANDLVVLEDPENLFAAQNVLPLIRTDANTPAVTEALNAVSAKLDTATLTELGAKVTVDKQDSAQVAQEWVEQNLGG